MTPSVTPIPKVSFIDVQDSAWYAEAVGFLAAKGITTGTGGNRYSPEAPLSRGQLLVMLMRAYAIAPEDKPSTNFTDAGSTYYTGYLAAARRLGFAKGIGNNRFAPDNIITRQETATLVYNILQLMGELPKSSTSGQTNVSGTSNQSLLKFSDADQVAEWAKEAMIFLVEKEIIMGNNGKLSPIAVMDRAQLAQVLYNLLKNKD